MKVNLETDSSLS